MNKECWQYKFLQEGSAKGFGDLSVMLIDVGDAREEALQQERERIIEEIKKIDFYGWNEETQRLIKDKITNINI